MRIQLSPVAKLLILLSFNVLALTFDKLENLVLLAILGCLAYVAGRPAASKIKITALVVLPPMWGIVLSQALFYQAWPRTVILTIIPPETPIIGWMTGGVYLYYQGLVYGIQQSLRLVAVVLVGLTVSWTTGEGALLRTLRRSLGNSKLSISVSIGVRFLRTITDEVKSVYTVFRLSGFKLTRPGDVARFTVPLVAQVVRRSYMISLTLFSRGFNPTRKSRMGEMRPSMTTLLSLLFLLFSLGLALIKVLTVLFLLDVLYVPTLKQIYFWALNNL